MYKTRAVHKGASCDFREVKKVKEYSVILYDFSYVIRMV